MNYQFTLCHIVDQVQYTHTYVGKMSPIVRKNKMVRATGNSIASMFVQNPKVSV